LAGDKALCVAIGNSHRPVQTGFLLSLKAAERRDAIHFRIPKKRACIEAGPKSPSLRERNSFPASSQPNHAVRLCDKRLELSRIMINAFYDILNWPLNHSCLSGKGFALASRSMDQISYSHCQSFTGPSA
jgi:hypothetical protein